MLKALACRLSSRISRSSTWRSAEIMQAKLQQRPLTAGSCLYFSRQVQATPVLASSLRLSEIQPRWSSRRLHTTVLTAAGAADDVAAAAADDAAGDEATVYQVEDWDAGYINFMCITGTVEEVQHARDEQQNDWVKVRMQVPTPGSNGFTSWYVINHGPLAADAASKLKQGQIVQTGGTLLQRDSIQRLGWSDLLPLPALFAESFGIVPQDQREELERRVVFPVMDKEVLNAFLASGGQQTRLAPPQPPAAFAAPPQEAAAPILAEGMPDQPTTDREAVWMSLFLENHLWVDQRATKTGRQPDFRKRVKQEGADALWIEDRRTPAWVKYNLDKLPGGIPYAMPDFIPSSALNGSPKDRSWAELFINYSAFWDNRISKFSPKSPDFAIKDKACGLPSLWLNEAPGWVVDNLSRLPAPPPPRT